MSQATKEKPRSRQYLEQALVFPLQPTEPVLMLYGCLESADFYREEERLAKIIAEPEQFLPHQTKTVSRKIIEQAMAVARTIARKGEYTVLVTEDELYDIRRTFSAPYAKSGEKSKPEDFSPEAASEVLDDLLTYIEEVGNPVWTARVAVALAYLSSLSK